jgi:hypothetical protein
LQFGATTSQQLDGGSGAVCLQSTDGTHFAVLMRWRVRGPEEGSGSVGEGDF